MNRKTRRTVEGLAVAVSLSALWHTYTIWHDRKTRIKRERDSARFEENINTFSAGWDASTAYYAQFMTEPTKSRVLADLEDKE